MGVGSVFFASAFVPSWSSAAVLLAYLGYLAVAGSVLPGKLVPGAVLSDGTRIHYRCNGLLSLLLLIILLGTGVSMNLVSPMVSLLLYVAGRKSRHRGSSLKSHVTGNFIHDLWFGVQLNPDFFGVDLKCFMTASFYQHWPCNGNILTIFCLQSAADFFLLELLYIIDYFFYEEYMTSTWDIIAEKLGFMLVFGDLVWIPFTFSIQACIRKLK
ncbi:hypothetical protein Taro_025165 [Colocasia esculenta]|uniref:Uncharacterized protein n=1 Tax=Colocasia esculenta TaxID=4460 RepID=A0A843VMK1_COLES|nr:hypothetical protein [Colocasia esculenta]